MTDRRTIAFLMADQVDAGQEPARERASAVSAPIDLDQLTDGDLREILLRCEELFAEQREANNQLMLKLMLRAKTWQGQDEAIQDLAAILNQWADLHTSLHQIMRAEVEVLHAGVLLQ